jgi:hypothetical protein
MTNKDEKATDDATVLWEELQEIQRKKMMILREETEKLQKEKDTMNSIVSAANISEDDIIEINAGGKIIVALRSTLTLVPDTMFSYMFSGRWEESLKRDSNGRVFIDENSELIEIIVDFLRMKKREDPSKPARTFEVRDDKKDNFLSLLNYYGLREFFYPCSQPSSVLDITTTDVVQPWGSTIDVTKSENKIQFSATNDKRDYVICRPPLDSSGEGAFWKVTINQLDINSCCLVIGIIGNLNPASNESQYHSTSYGWSSPNNGSRTNLYKGGAGCISSDWKGFAHGECLHFKFKSNRLSMYSVQKNRTFVMETPNIVDKFIHFNLLEAGAEVILESLNKEEREHLLEKLVQR